MPVRRRTFLDLFRPWAFALALAAAHAHGADSQLEAAFQLIGERVGLVVNWSRNILFTVVVGGILWSLVGWIGTGRIQLKPVLITLSAGVFLGIAQGILGFFIDLSGIAGTGAAGDLPADILAGGGGGGGDGRFGP